MSKAICVQKQKPQALTIMCVDDAGNKIGTSND